MTEKKFWRPDEICCQLDSNDKPSAYAAVKKLATCNIIIIIT